MKKYLLLWSVLWLYAVALQAQSGGIRGYVRSEDGEALPFTTIYVKNTQTGTASNNDGYYELKLPAGTYQLVFQYLSRQTFEKEITIGDEFVRLDVTLKLQTYMLREVEVRAGAEDPAYTIMRKAIAMSKVHKLQVDSYDARIYIKGTGRVLEIPFLLEKKLKEEGITEGKTFLTENITDLHFEQPNKYVKKVVAIRSSDKEPTAASPMDYIQASFYDPKIGDVISPLAPNAFTYYKFHLESIFRDRNYEVNKIRVTPRSRGDDVWEGFIYIVENKWCIHSLQLNTTKLGIDIGVQQTYSPVQDGVFMPITHQIKVGGSYLGFKAEFAYVASVSNYKIKVNPNFIPEVKLIDEKIEKERAEALKRQAAQNSGKGNDKQRIEDALASGKELTRKDLKKMLKDAEKQQLAAEKQQLKKGEPAPSEMVRNETVKIDTLARKRGIDNSFWTENRPIPLADFEQQSYKERDSLVRIDSVKKTRQVTDSSGAAVKTITTKKFKPTDLLFGGSYRTGKHSSLTLSSVAQDINYNTVEGFASDLRMTYRKSMKLHSLRVAAVGRYALARETFSGKGEVEWNYATRRFLSDSVARIKRGSLRLDGGRYIQQMSTDYPIPMILNTLSTLLFERNWMKLYERDYMRLRWKDELKLGLDIDASFEYARRMPLANLSDWKIFDWKSREFTSNDPENVEVTETSFPTHTAAVLDVGLTYRPLVRYGVSNGKRYHTLENSPILNFRYRRGFADVDYDFLSLGIQHQMRLGISAKLGYALSAGSFLNTNRLYFPDFKHFNGNQIFVQFADPVSSFRLLDYYRFSTSDKYLEGHAYVQFRKLLLTQFIYLRSFGWKENFFVNQLVTPKNNYTELGYSLDGILRLFRVEAIAAFENGQYKSWGVRVGITTTFGLRVSVD